MDTLDLSYSHILYGDARTELKKLPHNSVDMVFTSPTPGTYDLFSIFTKVWRVLKPSGTLWLNMSDYHDDKGNLIMIPERFVIHMIDMGGYRLKSKAIWHRTDKTVRAESYKRFRRNWEYVFVFTTGKEIEKEDYYFHNPEQKPLSAILAYPYTPPRQGKFESGFPEGLIETAIYRGCPEGGIVLDPMAGTGTTGLVAKRMGRKFIMIDKQEENYLGMTQRLRSKLVNR